MRYNIMANATASAAWCTLGKPFIQLSSGWGYYVLILIATCRYSHWPLKQLSTFDESLCVGIHKKTPACSHIKPIPRVNAGALTPCTPDVLRRVSFFLRSWAKKKQLLLQQRAPWQEISLSSQAHPPPRPNKRERSQNHGAVSCAHNRKKWFIIHYLQPECTQRIHLEIQNAYLKPLNQ